MRIPIPTSQGANLVRTQKAGLITSTPLASPALETTAVNTVIEDKSPMSQAVGNLGVGLSNWVVREREQQEVLDLLEYKNQLNKDYDELQQGLIKNPSTSSKKEVSDFNDGQLASLKMLQHGKSKKFQLQSRGLYDNQAADSQFKAHQVDATVRRLNWVDAMDRSVDSAMNNFVATNDISEYKKAAVRIGVEIEQAIGAGLIDAETGIKWTKGLESKEHQAILNTLQLRPEYIDKILTVSRDDNGVITGVTNLSPFSDDVVLQNSAQYIKLASTLLVKQSKAARDITEQNYIDTIALTETEDTANIFATSFPGVDPADPESLQKAFGYTAEQADNTASKYTQNILKYDLTKTSAQVTDYNMLETVQDVTKQKVDQFIDPEERESMKDYVDSYINNRKQLYYEDPVEYLKDDTTLKEYNQNISGNISTMSIQDAQTLKISHLKALQGKLGLGIPTGSIRYMTNQEAETISMQLENSDTTQAWDLMSTLSLHGPTQDIVNQLQNNSKGISTSIIQAYNMALSTGVNAQSNFTQFHRAILIANSSDADPDIKADVKDSDTLLNYSSMARLNMGLNAGYYIDGMSQLLIGLQTIYPNNDVEELMENYMVIEEVNEIPVLIVGDKAMQERQLEIIENTVDDFDWDTMHPDTQKWFTELFIDTRLANITKLKTEALEADMSQAEIDKLVHAIDKDKAYDIVDWFEEEFYDDNLITLSEDGKNFTYHLSIFGQPRHIILKSK